MSRHQTGIAGPGSGLRCSAISAEGVGQDKRLSDGMSAFPPWCRALTTPPHWMTMARVVTRPQSPPRSAKSKHLLGKA